MINAEATAENRPACGSIQHVYLQATWKTDEYQAGVQVFIILLDEPFIVFFRLLTILLVERRPVFFRDRFDGRFFATRGLKQRSIETQEDLPRVLQFGPFINVSRFRVILISAVIGGERDSISEMIGVPR